MQPNRQTLPKQYRGGELVWFYKLHYDCASRVGDIEEQPHPTTGEPERIQRFVVLGKLRPAIVLGSLPERHLLLWCSTATSTASAARIPQGLLKKASFLRRDQLNVRLTHQNFIDPSTGDSRVGNGVLGGLLDEWERYERTSARNTPSVRPEN